MKLGEFDPPSMNPFSQITMDNVQSPAHRKLATIAAKMSFVLLKNDNNFLPITEKVKTVAVSFLLWLSRFDISVKQNKNL